MCVCVCVCVRVFVYVCVCVCVCTILAAVDRMISVSLFSWLEPVPVLSLSSLRMVSLLNPSKLHTQSHTNTVS